MIIKKETQLNEKTYSIEVGRVARLADGACWQQFGDTLVMATVVGAEEARQDMGFFPLTVDYREKTSAAGKFPGGFIKREGRPSEKEILSARIIDRTIRPLFTDGYKNEVQVMISVLSADKENDPDVQAISAASTALLISGIPWAGPVAGVRVGRIDGNFIANPTHEERAESDLDLVIAATETSILMVEGEAQEISETDMIAALAFGQETAGHLIQVQKDIAAEVAKPMRELIEPEVTEALEDKVRQQTTDKIAELLKESEKQARRKALKDFYKTMTEELLVDYPESEKEIGELFHQVEKELVRKMAINDKRRLDGRGPTDIRNINCEVGILPRVHGSALFTRGQTQALASITLGTKVDEQKVDSLEGEYRKTFMLHYNFPPFSVGETRPLRGPGRREIGHGNLAERAIKAVMPEEGSFPYTVKVVSDVLESNGSSSMATVCAGSLALMDAGVPVKEGVAGIAMGLIKEGDDTVILTDILGDEDHLGDMDFKVAGTANGITAFQMDIKIKGLSQEILAAALEQAHGARMKILEIMNSTLSETRSDLSQYAPRILTVQVPTDSIGLIIGPGGKTIRDIIDRTGTTIDINDDGIVTIASADAEACDAAREIVEGMVAEPEVGKVYNGIVKGIKDFGAFIEIMPGREGLLHISQIENRRINKVEDVLKMGEEVQVKLIDLTSDGKLKLSRKVLLPKDDN